MKKFKAQPLYKGGQKQVLITGCGTLLDQCFRLDNVILLGLGQVESRFGQINTGKRKKSHNINQMTLKNKWFKSVPSQ